MKTSDSRLSITAINKDLTFSKQTVNLWVKLPPTHYEFRTDEDREGFAQALSMSIANLLNSEETELDCHLIVTSNVFDSVEWRDGYLKAAHKNTPPQYVDTFSAEMANHMWSYEFRKKTVYLAVTIGYRTDYQPQKKIFNIKAVDNLITRLTGEVDEYLTEQEIAFWEERARLFRTSLMTSPVKAEKVESAEIAYIIRKNMFPGMIPPSLDDLSVTDAVQWGVGELQTLTDAYVVNKPKWLEITQVLPNGVEFTGYRATLCFAKFPDVLRYPEREPWIHYTSLLGFPVDFYSRFSIIPSRKVQKQVTNKIKSFQDQAKNMTSAGGDVTMEVQENFQLGQYLEYALGKSDIPWLYGRHRIVVEADSEAELKERCQTVIDHYKNLGIIVVWSTGDQLALLQESMPNDRVRLSSYYQRHELNIIGAGVPAASGGVGDVVKQSASGVKSWLGPYLGYTTSRVVEPVCLSMHSALALNHPPGLVIAGGPGSGKSFTAFTLTYNMVLSGVQTVVIDPKQDALPLQTLPGCEGTTVIDMSESPDGILDPFQMGETQADKIDLVMDSILMFVGGIQNLTSIAQAELSKTIKTVLRDRYPSMNKLTEILLSSRVPDAAALGERLSVIRQLPYASLCFATTGKNIGPDALRLNRHLTIITLLGLDFPSSTTKKEDYSMRNQLAVAILFLLTSFTRKLMLSSSGSAAETHQKAIVIDEAWAVTSTSQGAKLVTEVARLGRRFNTALILVSQNAGDFLGENVTNSVSTKMCFKTEDPNEIKNVLDFLGLPKIQQYADVVRNLNTGECLMKDAEGRIARMQVDDWSPRNASAFQTNPEAIRQGS